LLDNGSVRASSTRRLRALAAALAERLGRPVDAVSLLHADKIDPKELGGRPGEIWPAYLKRLASAGERAVAAVPLFFGPSAAVVKRAPQIAAKQAELAVGFAPPLADARRPEDEGLAAALAERAAAALAGWAGEAPAALLVDHGSPSPEVARVRDLAAEQLARRLEGRVAEVRPCSMERREGEAYAFSDQLLAQALEEAARRWRRLLLCRMFLFPGRHAGPGGDVAEIVAASPWGKRPGDLRETPLVGESPLLLDLLERRAQAALAEAAALSAAC